MRDAARGHERTGRAMQFPPNDETQPLILGRYRREATLAQGRHGEVVRAFEVHLRRVVAIKILPPSLEGFRVSAERFERETEAAVRMGVHPNVVTIYDLDRDALGTCYLIMEYPDGGRLRERLANGPLPSTEALRIAADVARGLHVAHLHRVVHCDVKPSTIFLTAWGQAKIGDFGVAQVDGRAIWKTGDRYRYTGDAIYASGEQILAKTPLEPETDQYSRGRVLFEMLTGRQYVS